VDPRPSNMSVDTLRSSMGENAGGPPFVGTGPRAESPKLAWPLQRPRFQPGGMRLNTANTGLHGIVVSARPFGLSRGHPVVRGSLPAVLHSRPAVGPRRARGWLIWTQREALRRLVLLGRSPAIVLNGFGCSVLSVIARRVDGRPHADSTTAGSMSRGWLCYATD